MESETEPLLTATNLIYNNNSFFDRKGKKSETDDIRTGRDNSEDYKCVRERNAMTTHVPEICAMNLIFFLPTGLQPQKGKSC